MTHSTGHRTGRSLLLASLIALGGCTTAEYYWQAATGHMSVMAAREPIDHVMTRADSELRDKLAVAQAARRFAVEELGLPDNGSYTSYADIGRRYVLWNVVATPELSLEPKLWCMPVAGCVAYRGYYARDDAQELAAELRDQGLDVSVGGVAAYSTLGWFEDPVLNTMMHWPDHALAGLIIHELSHQKVYVKSDSAFSEAFATAVAQLGTAQWLRQRGDPLESERAARSARERARFVDQVERYRERLETLYASAASPEDKRAGKARLLAQMRDEYRRHREGGGGHSGYDEWFEKLNNARIAAASTYYTQVPAFLALFEALGGDWPRFFAEVERVGSLDPAARRSWTERWLGAAS